MKKTEWYENNKEWADVKPGWYQHTIPLPELSKHSDFVTWYGDILDWVYDSIPNCERHCRWAFDENLFCIKFRYERDYLLCVLRW